MNIRERETGYVTRKTCGASCTHSLQREANFKIKPQEVTVSIEVDVYFFNYYLKQNRGRLWW